MHLFSQLIVILNDFPQTTLYVKKRILKIGKIVTYDLWHAVPNAEITNCSGQQNNVLKVHFFACVHTRCMPLICAWIQWEILNTHSDKELFGRALFMFFSIFHFSKCPRAYQRQSTINNIHNRRFTNTIPNCIFFWKIFLLKFELFCVKKNGSKLCLAKKNHIGVSLLLLKAIISAIYVASLGSSVSNR